jgi:HemY protein
LLEQAYYQEGNWEKLNRLLPALKKYKVKIPETLAALEQEVAQHLLSSIAGQDSSIESRLVLLNDTWRTLSSSQIHNTQVIASYAHSLILLHADHDAEVILKNTLKKQWNEPCLRLMGEITGGDVAKRLTITEGWLRDHPHDPILLLTLGRISLRNQLWGKARTYFQESLHLAHTAEAYAELGRLCASLSEVEQSAGYFRQGLLLAQPLPDLPMPLMDSHKISPHLR